MSKAALSYFSVALLLSSALPARAGGQTAAWVSGQGSDAASCGSVAAPCRTFQYVHDTILGTAGGDILVHDPANYGSLTITKPLAILNDGVGTAGMSAPAGGTAITINAGSNDAITLRGLTLDGLGSAATGIAFNTGGRIEIQKSVFRNFTQMGMALLGSAYTYSISDTVVSDIPSRGVGIFINGPQGGNASAIQGILKNVDVSNAGLGVSVFNSNITIVNSNLDLHNGGWGVQCAGLIFVSIINTTINYNGIGINPVGDCGLILARSTIQSNDMAVGNYFASYGDNDINFNSMGTVFTPFPVARQ